MKDRADYLQMLKCMVSALRGRLSNEQVDWLMQERERADYFLAGMVR